MTLIRADVSAIRQVRWHEYGIRFLLGGLITMLTGLIARRFGPQVGGLFLAFPAIFPAAATLVSKHEEQKKQRHGFSGVARGRSAAALDACGAAMGSIALVAFAAVALGLLRNSVPALALSAATLAWAVMGFLIWWARHA